MDESDQGGVDEVDLGALEESPQGAEGNDATARLWRWWARIPILIVLIGGVGGVVFGLANESDARGTGFYLVAAILGVVLLVAALIEVASTGSRLIQLEGTISRKVRWQKVRIQSSAEVAHPHRGVEGIKEREVQISVLRRQIAAIYAVTGWNLLGFALTEGAALHVLFNGVPTSFSFLSAAAGLWLSIATLVALVARRFGDLDFYLLKRG